MHDPAIYAARREKLMNLLGPKAVLVVASQPERARNGDASYTFRQSSDVLYLTGFAEPETLVVIRPGGEPGTRFTMFVRPRDLEMETWNGRRAGLEGAVAKYGADVAFSVDEIDSKLPDLIANHDELHYEVGLDDAMDLRITHLIARLRRSEKRGKRPPRALVDLRASLHELRLVKHADELDVMRRAAAITSEAHVAAMRTGRAGTTEYQLEATIAHTFRAAGGNGPGYTSIVGAGDNATILHYVENDQTLAHGDLVLIDAGCEVNGYTADVTRTFPSSGKFSPIQRRVYELVLAVQERAIAACRPGATLEQIHNDCVRGLTAGMIELGLLTGTVDERVADLSYKRFYMHGTSHWLGLDVHDVGAYTIDGASRPLRAGMVITVEPGLYVATDAVGVPDELRGIGVRIEDDILITNEGHENLTAACPKSISAIEAVCAA